ncbi:hypothetical protein OHR68_06650 [Spirillospora sp. NBC_00431]
MDIKNYEWQSDWAKSHNAQGKAEGEAEMLLVMLEARGVAVPNDVRERVMACSDTEQLKHWGRRAAVIDSADELFA